MRTHGFYSDGRTYEVPADWIPLSETVLVDASERAGQAMNDDAIDRLTTFYNVESDYAGTSFLNVKPNSPDSVDAADLYAVSRLSITVTNRQGRLLLDDGAARARTADLLAAIPPHQTITDLSPSVLVSMWDLYNHFRTLLATDTRTSNYWVFASKLCARKRPLLFPVRDSVVCGYLSGGQPLAGSARQAREGRLGWFSSDIQVFAYLATHEGLAKSLDSLTDEASNRNVRVDEEPLRLLDVLLWTHGMGLLAGNTE